MIFRHEIHIKDLFCTILKNVQDFQSSGCKKSGKLFVFGDFFLAVAADTYCINAYRMKGKILWNVNLWNGNFVKAVHTVAY